MENNRTRKLAGMGELAAVEVSNDEHSIVHIHFMNTSLRMCARQFEKYTIMLNEAMMNLNKKNQYYYQMKEMFTIYREMKNLDQAGKKLN